MCAVSESAVNFLWGSLSGIYSGAVGWHVLAQGCCTKIRFLIYRRFNCGANRMFVGAVSCNSWLGRDGVGLGIGLCYLDFVC